MAGVIVSSIPPPPTWLRVARVALSEFVWSVLGLALIGAAPARLSGQGTQRVRADDARVFEAVIAAIPAVAVWGRFEVFPAPIQDEPELAYPAEDFRAQVDSAIVAARVAVLHRMSVSVATTTRIRDCPGLLAAGDTLSTCPREPVTRVALGYPRPVPERRVPEWRGAGRLAGRSADIVVRVLFVSLGPVGSMLSTAEYYLKRDSYGWEVVAERVLYILE